MSKLIDDNILQERFAEHLALAQDYVSAINAENGTEIYINDAALYLAIKSAYDDIERYKIYHLEKPYEQKSNSVKRAAYLTKWLMKTRPLHAPNAPDTTNILPLLANAGFCLTIARSHISGELCKEFMFSLQKEYEMTYDLTFREMNGDALLSMYQNFFDVAQGYSLLEDLADYQFVESSE